MDKPKFKPVVKRRRKSFYETLADQDEEEGLDVIAEDEEIVFDSEPTAFVTQVMENLQSQNEEDREAAVHTIVGLKLEYGRKH